jgi:hypothetical protein
MSLNTLKGQSHEKVAEICTVPKAFSASETFEGLQWITVSRAIFIPLEN